jgi:hypothetical protein
MGRRYPATAADERSRSARYRSRACPLRGNTLATSTPLQIVQIVHPVRRKPSRTDNLETTDTTNTLCARLRALSGVSRVGVRVSLGALKSPANVLFIDGLTGSIVVSARVAVATLESKAFAELTLGDNDPMARRQGENGLAGLPRAALIFI